MNHYTVKELAELAGVTVRTLHHYDKIGLLPPAERSEVGYRLYGDEQQLRLQQILFFKNLDFPLEMIENILDQSDFDVIESLKKHQQALKYQMRRSRVLLKTIESTINQLKEGTMPESEQLFNGLSLEAQEKYRKEAEARWGDSVKKSIKHLKNMTKAEREKLQADFSEHWKKLAEMSASADPVSTKVQTEIAKHYIFMRQFWGTVNQQDPQAEGYAALGQMYIADARFTEIEGKQYPKFGPFMAKAMRYYAEVKLDLNNVD